MSVIARCKLKVRKLVENNCTATMVINEPSATLTIISTKLKPRSERFFWLMPLLLACFIVLFMAPFMALPPARHNRYRSPPRLHFHSPVAHHRSRPHAHTWRHCLGKPPHQYVHRVANRWPSKRVDRYPTAPSPCCCTEHQHNHPNRLAFDSALQWAS